MVQRHLAARGICDERVLAAMSKVERERFVPPALRDQAYDDCPLPIGAGQTISQPYIVAYMVEGLAIEPGDRVLEVGAGSGYAAAVLGELANEVYTVERIGELHAAATQTLQTQGYDNVHVLHADGTCGWGQHAPFDAILVSAGAPEVPESLQAQLAIGGRMVIPVGRSQLTQELLRVIRVAADRYDVEHLAGVRFVPLIGKEGWADRAG